MTGFISRKYGEDGFEVIIETNSEEHYKAAEAFARRLINHAKPQTNADRIREMTDEELAKFIGSDSLCEHISTEHNEWCRCHNCADCIVEWLQQPAEVE